MKQFRVVCEKSHSFRVHSRTRKKSDFVAANNQNQKFRFTMRRYNSNSGNYRNPCITMHQPWASLLVYGIKRIEGRTWPAPITGLILCMHVVDLFLVFSFEIVWFVKVVFGFMRLVKFRRSLLSKQWSVSIRKFMRFMGLLIFIFLNITLFLGF